MSKQEKNSPRAMPVETIITRFKLKQKLLEENKKKATNSDKKIKKANKKCGRPKKKVTVTKEKEIHPKFKRKIVNKINLEKRTIKKIVLTPKHCYTLIGGMKSYNKRKMRTPRKEISLISEEERERRTKEQEPDMLQLMEDCGSLDEEDLLEILTCPSPVWWEDPPDGYIEEPIFSSPQPQYEQKSIKTQLLEETKRNKEENQVTKVELSNKRVDNSIPLEINVVNRDSTFINKRSKLELLLGNIKNRNHVNKNTKNVKNKRKLKAKRKKVKKENFNPIKKNINDKIDNDKRRDSLNLSDLGDDEILNHLESINIPMDDVIHKDDDDDHMSAEYLDMSLFDDDDDKVEEFVDKVNNDQLSNKVNDIAEEVLDKTNDNLLTNEVNGNDIAEQVIDKTNHDLLTNEINDNDKAHEIIDKTNHDLLTNEINDKAHEIIDKTNHDLLTNEINDNDIAQEVIDKTNNDLLTNEINDNDITKQVIDITSDDLLTKEINDNDLGEEVIDITNDDPSINEIYDSEMAEEVIDITNDDLLSNEIKDNDTAEEVIDITDDDLLTNKVNDNVKVEKVINEGLLINAVNDNDKAEKLNDKVQEANDKVVEMNDKDEVNDNGDDLLTVYKVIDNDPNKLQFIIPKTGNDKIDNYYKQMKKMNKLKDKSIMISEADAIRYCFVCSSIFDTKNCGYCDKKKYSCDICGIKVNAKSEMIRHLNKHISRIKSNSVCNNK